MNENELVRSHHYRRFKDILRNRTGFILRDDNITITHGKIEASLEENGFQSINQYLSEILEPRNELLLDSLIFKILNNETRFYRDISLFETLKKSILPKLIADRDGKQEIKIWSCACSSGQEPYSLAMLIRQTFESYMDKGWIFNIFASDLSEPILRKAENGRYSSLEVGRGLSDHQLVKYFHRIENDYYINDEIKEMVKFSILNLTSAWPCLPVFDIILMRNVLIYFDIETKRKIFSRLETLLSRDGYLILGSAESIIDIHDAFEWFRDGKVVLYRKKSLNLESTA